MIFDRISSKLVFILSFLYSCSYAQDGSVSSSQEFYTSNDQLIDLFNVTENEKIQLRDKRGKTSESLTIECGILSDDDFLDMRYILPDEYIRHSFSERGESSGGSRDVDWVTNSVDNAWVRLEVSCRPGGNARAYVKAAYGRKDAGFVKIRNKNHRKCLNLKSQMNRNGGLPEVWSCRSNHDQEWSMIPLGDDYFKIENRAHGKCLNLQSPANENGGTPNVWDCVTHSDQIWKVEFLGSGYAKIRNKNWNKCLNLQNTENSDGGLPDVWDCVTHPDQEWRIYPAH